MQHLKNVMATTGLVFALMSGAALAQGSGSEGEFTIFNKSGGNIVIGFYTNDGDGWSDNWLSEDLRPNESAKAAFTADSGACAQTLQIGWLGENGSEVMDEPIDIDICEATNVYLDDNEIYYD